VWVRKSAITADALPRGVSGVVTTQAGRAIALATGSALTAGAIIKLADALRTLTLACFRVDHLAVAAWQQALAAAANRVCELALRAANPLTVLAGQRLAITTRWLVILGTAQVLGNARAGFAHALIVAADLEELACTVRTSPLVRTALLHGDTRIIGGTFARLRAAEHGKVAKAIVTFLLIRTALTWLGAPAAIRATAPPFFFTKDIAELRLRILRFLGLVVVLVLVLVLVAVLALGLQLLVSLALCVGRTPPLGFGLLLLPRLCRGIFS
jgi:hypothetical protein